MVLVLVKALCAFSGVESSVPTAGFSPWRERGKGDKEKILSRDWTIHLSCGIHV
jgi:hypothetical protein